MTDFELPDDIEKTKKNSLAKKKKRKELNKIIWETKLFMRCKSCRTLQLKERIAYYWCSTEENKKHKASSRILWSSTCRFCGNKMNGK